MASALIIPTSELFKGIIASPAVAALIGALYQLFRDQAAFEKQKYFADQKRVFDIGATSHMANTAFDKHVEFCEKYMQEVDCTVTTLFKEGPSKEAYNHATNSYLLRREYAAWLTDEMNTSLEPYEQAVREIGAWAGFVKATQNSPQYEEQRSAKLEKIYQKFNEILSIDDKQEINEIYAIEAVKKKIRKILGIEELTQIRKYLIKQAVKAVEKQT